MQSYIVASQQMNMDVEDDDIDSHGHEAKLLLRTPLETLRSLYALKDLMSSF